MRTDLNLKTAINVFAESLDYPPTKKFEPYKHVVSCDYYPHAVEVRQKLINEGFMCHEIEPMCDAGPTSIPQIECPFEVVISTREHLDKLRSILNSGNYYLVEY